MKKGIRIWMGVLVAFTVMMFLRTQANAALYEARLLTNETERTEVHFMQFNANNYVYINYTDGDYTIGSQGNLPENYYNAGNHSMVIPANTILLYEGKSASCDVPMDSNLGIEITSLLERIEGNTTGCGKIDECKNKPGHNIKHIVISKGVKNIPDNTFYGKNLTEIRDVQIGLEIEKNNECMLESIGTRAFSGCKGIKYIDISSVKTLGTEAFSECSGLTYIKIGNEVTEIPDKCFYKCSSLQEVTFNSKLNKIGKDAFSSCGLNAVNIPDSVTSLGQSAFYSNHSLKSLVIGNSLKEIPNYCFQNCEKLSKVVWGSIETIGQNGFFGCYGLPEIVLPETVKSIGTAAFCAGVNTSSVTTRVVIPEGCTTIGDDAFCNVFNLTEISLPSTLTDVGRGAFVTNDDTVVKYAGTEDQLADIDFHGDNKIVTENNIVYVEPGNPNKPASRGKITGIILSAEVFYYDGKIHCPVATVKSSIGDVISGYTASNADVKLENEVKNYKPGTYKVKATGLGKYEGSAEVSYRIAVKPTSIKKISATKNSIKISVKKQAPKYVSGYEARYSLKANMSKAKKITVGKKSTATSTVIKKLSPKKKYYVQVRSYVKVGKKTFYSDWSKAKSVSTKKK